LLEALALKGRGGSGQAQDSLFRSQISSQELLSVSLRVRSVSRSFSQGGVPPLSLDVEPLGPLACSRARCVHPHEVTHSALERKRERWAALPRPVSHRSPGTGLCGELPIEFGASFKRARTTSLFCFQRAVSPQRARESLARCHQRTNSFYIPLADRSQAGARTCCSRASRGPLGGRDSSPSSSGRLHARVHQRTNSLYNPLRQARQAGVRTFLRFGGPPRRCRCEAQKPF
jgi:hypothetical protein